MSDFTYKVVNFKEFIAAVPRKQFNNRIYSFDTKVSEIKDEDTSTYQRKTTLLTRGNSEKMYLKEFLLQSKLTYEYKLPIQELYEKLDLEHLGNWGIPVMLVKLGSRRYVMVDPEDFEIIEGRHGSALVNLGQSRTVVVEMCPFTERQAYLEATERFKNQPETLEYYNIRLKHLDAGTDPEPELQARRDRTTQELTNKIVSNIEEGQSKMTPEELANENNIDISTPLNELMTTLKKLKKPGLL